MSRPKAYTIRDNSPDIYLSFFIQSAEFDQIVDDGYDIIVFVTPKGRYTAGVDEWQDYGYYDIEPGVLDIDDDIEVIRLNKSYMGKA